MIGFVYLFVECCKCVNLIVCEDVMKEVCEFGFNIFCVVEVGIEVVICKEKGCCWKEENCDVIWVYNEWVECEGVYLF